MSLWVILTDEFSILLTPHKYERYEMMIEESFFEKNVFKFLDHF
jgi:hypothetical protein